ncbi:hypothetical protein BGZ99_000983 [Dissophora globulifera]|uniref:Uncharacterized protein n=1 Tax=Dissophora globulifera TaxID=979702 RepID=A0A9P6UKW8_9FUNG|nr:hypothetical protein BGZ99_000983 [Dissophora globulifera]
MAPLLESTRNYLKSSSQRLGRGMSAYKEDASGSDTSLNADTTTDKPLTRVTSHNSTKTSRPTSPTSTKKRLSGLFILDARPKSPQPAEHPLVTRSQSPDLLELDFMREVQQSKSAQKSEAINKSTNSGQAQAVSYSRSLTFTASASASSGDDSPHHRARTHHGHGPRSDHASEHMENQIPRGTSPTLSMSNTISTATSSYDMQPSDYPNIRQYQTHVWRRNILEQSIMHSLRLGYADRHRSSSRHGPHSSKRESLRTRKAREKAIFAAATGSETSSQENIIDRSLKAIDSDTRPQPTFRTAQQQPQFRYDKNSPYQLEYNASMSNIRESFASFTLELPDHHASHIMASSAIPDLFRIKTALPVAGARLKSRSRRSSRTSTLSSGVALSPRGLNGKKMMLQSQAVALPDVMDADEEEEEEEEEEDVASLQASSWAETVFASLDKVTSSKTDSMTEERLQVINVAPARAV